MKRIVLFSALSFIFFTCNFSKTEEKKEPSNKNKIELKKEYFGEINGEKISLFTITNANGVKLSITNYGGIITHLHVPDRNGISADVVLGFDSLDGYLGDHPYFGALVGRYGNRIADGQFSINGKTYSLPINNEPNSLHGGIKGFDKKIWEAKEIIEKNASGIELTGVSLDKEEGYPGNLTINAKYLLNNENELRIQYNATTDKPTVINLTNHSYFNLKGAGNGDILDHELTILADKITPVNESLIPTGKFLKVADGPFDFTISTKIGKRIDDDDQQLVYGGGYDHNFVLSDSSENLKSIAKVYELSSGREMEVFTTEPGVQFYTGNFLDGTILGKDGKHYQKRYGFCLETQHFPDSPNQPEFPTTQLNPGEEYKSTTVYKFSAR